MPLSVGNILSINPSCLKGNAILGTGSNSTDLNLSDKSIIILSYLVAILGSYFDESRFWYRD